MISYFGIKVRRKRTYSSERIPSIFDCEFVSTEVAFDVALLAYVIVADIHIGEYDLDG